MNLKKKKIGLILKISVLVGFIEVIIFSLMTFLYVSQYSKHIERDLHNRISHINKMFANEEIPISAMAQVKYMTSMVGEQFLEGYVLGSNGIVIISSKPEYLGKTIDAIPSIQKDWILNQMGEKLYEFEDRLTSVAYLNNAYTTTPLYQTIITISTKSLESLKRSIIQMAILGAIFFIFLSTFAISLFARYFLTNRIDKSLDVLKNVEEGNIDARIDICERDEIGMLQNGINSMISKVSLLLNQYKESTQKILEQKEEFESIFDYSQDGIIIVDQDMNLLNFNNAFLND